MENLFKSTPNIQNKSESLSANLFIYYVLRKWLVTLNLKNKTSQVNLPLKTFIIDTLLYVLSQILVDF